MQVEFTDAEVELMQQVLDREMRDLSFEIADTDNSRFRDKLRARRDTMSGLLEKFGGPLPDREA
ncbi:MAG: hypothetical protein WCE80_03160 [Acidimicrobiia bacterium]